MAMLSIKGISNTPGTTGVKPAKPVEELADGLPTAVGNGKEAPIEVSRNGTIYKIFSTWKE